MQLGGITKNGPNKQLNTITSSKLFKHLLDFVGSQKKFKILLTNIFWA